MLKITLAAARVNAGLTQKEVAKDMHISHTTLIEWEKGKDTPKVSQLRRLFELYDIGAEYLIVGGVRDR